MHLAARALAVAVLIALVLLLPHRSDDDRAAPTPEGLGDGPTTTTPAPTTTVAPPPTTERRPDTTWFPIPDYLPPPVVGPFYALGDSVMLGAKAELQAAGVDQVNAAVSRQLATGTGILRGVSDHTTLVAHLGTNGPASAGTVDALMQAAVEAGFHNILVVTIQLPARYNYEASMNDTLRAAARKWGATVLDWEALSNENPSFLARDGIHLTAAGRAGFTELITEALFVDAGAEEPDAGSGDQATSGG